MNPKLNYKEMYWHLRRQTEDAMEILERAIDHRVYLRSQSEEETWREAYLRLLHRVEKSGDEEREEVEQ